MRIFRPALGRRGTGRRLRCFRARRFRSDRIVSIDLRKRYSVRKHQRKIALDCWESRQRFETPRGVRRFDAGDERLELQFGDEDVLTEFVYVRDALGELAG